MNQRLETHHDNYGDSDFLAYRDIAIDDFRKSKKVKVIFNKKNGGVGYAMKAGYSQSLKDNIDLSVKIDADGQMDPGLIKFFIEPLIFENYDYTKGNRFGKIKNIFNMPIMRILGNIFFSLLAKITTKNTNLFDFHNGYTAIKNDALKKINYKNLDDTFFFLKPTCSTN